MAEHKVSISSKVFNLIFKVFQKEFGEVDELLQNRQIGRYNGINESSQKYQNENMREQIIDK